MLGAADGDGVGVAAFSVPHAATARAIANVAHTLAEVNAARHRVPDITGEGYWNTPLDPEISWATHEFAGRE